MAGGVVLIVVGGLIVYLTFFRRGVKQGLRKVWEADWQLGTRSWLPFAFLVSLMPIVLGAVFIYRAIGDSYYTVDVEEGGVATASIGPMTVSIPADWERTTEEHTELTEAFASAMLLDIGQEGAYFDVYQHKSRDASLALAVMDMKSKGVPWRGVYYMAKNPDVTGVTKETFALLVSVSLIGKAIEELPREVYRQVTIHGNDAWESQYTSKWLEGEPTRSNLLVVLGEDVVGILMMVVEEAKWGNFKETWDKIRDSVEFTTAE